MAGMGLGVLGRSGGRLVTLRRQIGLFWKLWRSETVYRDLELELGLRHPLVVLVLLGHLRSIIVEGSGQRNCGAGSGDSLGCLWRPV